jgi:hypothetical protein
MAKMLNVHHLTVLKWAKKGILDGIRDARTGHYWIKISPEQISALKKQA